MANACFYLHDKGLSAPSGSRANQRHVRSLIDEVLQAVENTTPCCGCPAVDTPLVDGLARHARVRVYVVVACSENTGLVRQRE